ncbi:hypothetical protein CsSME_00007940 [Camellia sinensis var. sinensis]
MAIFHGILLLTVLLFVPMAAAATVGLGGGAEEQDLECLPTRCREHHGPEIRFPFRLIGKQPEHCGFKTSTYLPLPSQNITAGTTTLASSIVPGHRI